MLSATTKLGLDRLAFSTNAFKKTTARDAVATIARLGYAGCEIMADQPHMTPSELHSGDVDELQQQIEDAGLRVSNVNAFTGFFAAGTGPGALPTGDTYHPTWIEDDASARSLRVAHTLSCIRLAAALGAGTVSLQPGGPTVGTDLSREEAGRRFAKGIAACLPTARSLGVTLTIEPEPGLYLQTSEEYRQWKAAHFPDEPLVKMNCDLGHLYCVGEDPAGVIRAMPEEIAHVHLEDIADTRVHQHLTPGDGALDFRGIFAALDDIGYAGWVTVELYPFMNDPAGVAKRALDHLRPMLDH